MNKIYRSQRDKKIFGLFGGLAEALNVDATLLRVVAVVTAFFSGGTIIPIYILVSLVVPKEAKFDLPMPHYAHSAGMNPPPQSPNSNLDDLMKDIETKAMRKEIEQLRQKISQYENEKGAL